MSPAAGDASGDAAPGLAPQAGMKFLHFSLALAALLLGGLAFGQDGWTLKRETHGMKIYARKSDSFKIDELRVETTMPGSLEQFIAAIMDIDHHNQWVYRVQTASLLKRNGPVELYYHTVLHSPWPMQNRDIVSRMTLRHSPADRSVQISINSANHLLPPQKGLMRVPFCRGQWNIRETADNKLHIDYRIQVETDDVLPAWIINLFATKGPEESFIRLRNHIRKPAYSNARLPFTD